MKTPFIENWVGKGSYLGAGRVYYKLQGLNPGEVYYAQALVRSYNEANADAPNGPNFFINDDVVDMTEAGTTFTYNGMSGIYATLRGAATVGLDGTLTLGVQIAEDRNYNWVAFKSISIRSMKDALKAVIEETEATIPTANVGTGVFQFSSAAVSARQTKIDAAQAVYDDVDVAVVELQIVICRHEDQMDHHHLPQLEEAEEYVRRVQQRGYAQQKVEDVDPAAPVGAELPLSAQNGERQQQHRRHDVDERHLQPARSTAIRLVRKEVDRRAVERQLRQYQPQYAQPDQPAVTNQKYRHRQYSQDRGGEKQVLHDAQNFVYQNSGVEIMLTSCAVGNSLRMNTLYSLMSSCGM